MSTVAEFPSSADFNHDFKVLVVGEPRTGKSSFSNRATGEEFDPECKPTTGVDYKQATLQLNAEVNVRINLWDLAGQERLREQNPIYYRGAKGAIVLFDMTNRNSFEITEQWKKIIDEQLPSPIPVLLVGNKIDLLNESEQACTTAEEIGAFCTKYGFFKHIGTSAKTGANIEEAIRTLVLEILSTHKSIQKESPSYVTLSAASAQKNSESGCCQ